MLDIFKRVFVFFRRQSVQTDSFVFRLHHSATVALLLIFCLIVGLQQYVMSPIKCISSDIPLNVLDVHCFTLSPFTAAETVYKKIGSEVAHPGVTPPSNEDSIKSLSYYPWVFLSLFFQVSRLQQPNWLRIHTV
jgi:hypothetical protein